MQVFKVICQYSELMNDWAEMENSRNNAII